MNKAVNERELVLDILMEVSEKGMYSHIVLREVLSKYQYMDKKERAFITRVSEGTLEHMLELDYILDQFSKVKVRKMKPVIRNILRSAVYQLKYMDTVPDSAVCNEAVKLAVRKGFVNLKGFVNGVLRNVARNLDNVKYPKEELQRLSVRYSMPEWILKLWLQSYDGATVERMLAAFQAETPLTVRCNLQHNAPEELVRKLTREGAVVQQHPYLPYAFTISGYDYLADLDSFQNGDFYVQDVSSMLVGEIASPKEGDTVMDVCAAPGGKSLHIAEKLNETGRVQARDLSSYKVELIEDNILRSGFQNIEAVVWDALELDESAKETADILLADLPCSGLGVLGRKTDLKYKATLENAQKLAELQRQILQTVQCYVKPGGKLLYSTCTIHAAENMENVDWFLEHFPAFSLMDIRESVPEELKGDVQNRGCLQLLPGVHQSDGFFIAAFQKKAESGKNKKE